MKKRIIWLVVSGLMALSLVLASCAPQVTEEKKEVVAEKKEVVAEKKEVVTEKKEVVTEKKEAEMVVDTLGRLVPKPQYGGVLNLAEANDDTRGWTRTGQNRQPPTSAWVNVTNEPLLRKDRLKGPDGSGEWSGRYNIYPPVHLLVGNLAESWEVIQPDTLKFKIRKGIPWQDKAPTYGAELTAEDVVYTFMTRWARPGSVYPTQYPVLSNMAKPAESIYVSPDDPRTVVFKSAPGQLPWLWEVMTNYDVIVPKALGAIEGEGFVDWRGVVGTGAFVLTDYVAGSSITWQRNPNYWAKDQFHPQNQLPYLDGLKIFIVPDLSTQQAALRTGKIDILESVEAEDADGLMRTNPQLRSAEILKGNALDMRNDVAPFTDVRVRRAMTMAIDYDGMVRDYYGGKAVKFWWPGPPIAEYSLWYRPLEEMPKSVQELYTYNPDKAKQLLAEAGYPNGFTTSVTVSSALEKNIDLASVIAAYWAKVGVTLKIDLKEPAVLSAMQSAFTYPHGVFNSLSMPAEFIKFYAARVGSRMNYARINDPLIQATYEAITTSYFDWAEVSRIQREATPELQSRALHILLPLVKSYNLWQPWVGGFQGEGYPEYQPGLPAVSRYVWIDQKLKKAMGR